MWTFFEEIRNVIWQILNFKIPICFPQILLFVLTSWKRRIGILMSWHSMARANLNKSEWLVTNTSTASKYIPKRPRICINWNPTFRPHILNFSKSVSYEVNITSQHSHLEVLLLRKFGSEMGDFNWCRFWTQEVLWCCGK